MSKAHLISTLATGFAFLAATCWLVSGAFPLTAQPQIVNDAPGVTVSLNGAGIMHRTSVGYPANALQRGIQGTLSLEVKLDSTGNVSDAKVLTGPDELRKSALESVLQWHFSHDAAGTTRVVSITYELPRTRTATGAEIAPTRGVTGGIVGGVPGGVRGGVVGGVLGGIIGSVPTGVQTPMPTRVRGINVLGVSTQVARELLASLPVHEGDELTPELMTQTMQAVQAFDEHFTVQRTYDHAADGSPSLSLIIGLPGANRSSLTVASVSPAMSNDPNRIKVGGNVQSTLIVSKVQPVYPQLAKSARVSGVVHLQAVIAKDGTVQELHSLGGPALLIQAAMDAVKQWVYRPTLLAGQPVSVETTIDVNFTLNE